MITSASRYRSLPTPLTTDGSARRVGIEVEFGGMTESEVAEALVQTLGGRIEASNDFQCEVHDSAIGLIEVYLDTAYRKDDRDLVAKGVEAARGVLPVEIVTEPLDPGVLPDLERALDGLRSEGATGTDDGLLLGFGLHLNVELPELTVDHIHPVLLAFALLEPVLRDATPIDLARRIQPFVKPYPSALIDALARATPDDICSLAEVYLAHTTSRNHGLDVLPILRESNETLIVERVENARAVAARPAWHYRLPDSRVSDPDWSLADVWNRWVGLEEAAADPALLSRLSEAWLDYRSSMTSLPSTWVVTARDLIANTTLDKELAA